MGISLFSNIRFYILLFSALLATTIFTWAKLTIVDEAMIIIRLTQFYAFMAVIFLYLALLATPIIKLFPTFPLNQKFLKARRAIGVSAFFFALLHASLAFFGQLGGFSGLLFLNNTYLLAIILSFIALFILFLLAITSFDYIIAKLTFPKWKKLQRFVYLSGILIVIHALILGTHFQDLSLMIPKIFFAALIILLLLEAKR